MRSLLTSLMLNEAVGSLWAMALMAPRGRSAAAPKEVEEETEEEASDDGEPLGIIELEDNLEDVEKPKEVPPGMYIGEVQNVEKKVSGKGNNYFAIKFVIMPEELPANVRESYPDGATLYWNRQVVPNGKDRRALYNLKVFMQALGLDTNVSQIDPSEWMGCTAKLRLIYETYQGITRATIRSVESAEAPARTTAAKPKGKR